MALHSCSSDVILWSPALASWTGKNLCWHCLTRLAWRPQIFFAVQLTSARLLLLKYTPLYHTCTLGLSLILYHTHWARSRAWYFAIAPLTSLTTSLILGDRMTSCMTASGVLPLEWTLCGGSWALKVYNTLFCLKSNGLQSSKATFTTPDSITGFDIDACTITKARGGRG